MEARIFAARRGWLKYGPARGSAMPDSRGGGAPRSNLLGGEASPYLLQHASNPVWWHAWDDAALKRAVDEDKPIFLSVGYSSCHWCHVMAHESFEDGAIAALLNEHFVSIKVDREERPDVDDVYQKACQMATGQGGWPLSVFLTPDRKPFYAGTYFPPSDIGGRRGFGSVVRWLAQAWAEHRSDVAASAEKFAETLRRAEASVPFREDAQKAAFDRAAADEAAVNLLHIVDEHNGGFGSAPKFPNSACVSLMLRYGRMAGLARFTRLALRTLDRMAAGGIFDHVGGGFHRYSTDSRWLVPHFEKMLYDNALIPVNYAEAYQATGDAAYLDVMDRTLSYMLRELAAPCGGFYSAQDADAGGEEGLYYTWTRREVLDVLRGGEGGGRGALSAAEADAFCAYYDVTDGGNWEGRTILCNSAPLHAVAFRFGIGDDAAREALRAGRAKLLEHRGRTREAPGLDDNVIASWSALAASALAAGHRVSPARGYLDAAARCAERVAFGMRDAEGGGVSRVARRGRDPVPGGLDDHAHCANALLDVFEARPEERYLERAAELGRLVCGRFWDEESGGFFMTADSGGGGDGNGGLVVRPRSRHDMSVPSGGSAAVRALMRLHAFTGEAEPGRVAARALAAQAREAAENPFAFGHLLCAAFSAVDCPPEVTIVNPAASDIAKRVLSMYLPGSPVVTVPSAGHLAAVSRYPYFAGKPFGDRTEVYVCRAGACSAPMDTLGQVEAELARASCGGNGGGHGAAAGAADLPRAS